MTINWPPQCLCNTNWNTTGPIPAYPIHSPVATPTTQVDECSIQDCHAPIEKWMVTEMAPGRPTVYGVCGRDLALITLAEAAYAE